MQAVTAACRSYPFCFPFGASDVPATTLAQRNGRSPQRRWRSGREVTAGSPPATRTFPTWPAQHGHTRPHERLPSRRAAPPPGTAPTTDTQGHDRTPLAFMRRHEGNLDSRNLTWASAVGPAGRERRRGAAARTGPRSGGQCGRGSVAGAFSDGSSLLANPSKTFHVSITLGAQWARGHIGSTFHPTFLILCPVDQRSARIFFASGGPYNSGTTP
eukprot:scaffold30_cov416-Prasinococcus_capsulatus_cf.AAC.36